MLVKIQPQFCLTFQMNWAIVHYTHFPVALLYVAGKKFWKAITALYKKYFTFGNKLKRINSSDDATEFSLLEFTLSKH